MENHRKWRAILLFGAPGSGKGTQGAALGMMPGYLHIASGDIFRQLDKQSQLGQEVENHTSVGKLVPDELTIDIWREHLTELITKKVFDPENHVIISDGIPRTYRQAQLLADRWEVLRIFELKLEEEDAVQRIKNRALEQNRTDDAKEAVIRQRFRTFYEETERTLTYYDPSIVVQIDASRLPMQVLRDLTNQICQLP